MKQKPKIEELPCYPQVASVLGAARAKMELFRALQGGPVSFSPSSGSVWGVFVWDRTVQGAAFWRDVANGEVPSGPEA